MTAWPHGRCRPTCTCCLRYAYRPKRLWPLRLRRAIAGPSWMPHLIGLCYIGLWLPCRRQKLESAKTHFV